MEKGKNKNIKNLVENFFKNLKCNITCQNEVLNIKDVPENFEKFYGKKSPYSFIFDKAIQTKFENAELISSGSLLLKVMANFLENKAQTTLLKLDLDCDFKKIVSKHFNFKNCEISSIGNTKMNDLIWRFTFLTSFQYLNEKEQIINSVYVHDGSVIENFDLKNYKNSQGKKQDIIIPDMKLPYTSAKEILKSRLKEKTTEVSTSLNQSLEKEIKRIEEHYSSLLCEANQDIERNSKRLKELESKLESASVDETVIIRERINRINATLAKLKQAGELEKLNKEKIFFLNDEKQKHSLNINNSLMNTTIIYYPIYTIKIYLKKNGKLKQVELTFNPLTMRMYPLFCDSCKKEIHDVNICSSGHIVCNNCVSQCLGCAKEVCSICQKKNCHICDKQICKNCASKCSKCWKHFCSNHTVIDYMTDEKLCTQCGKYCFVCGNHTEKSFFKTCYKCNKEICPKCLRKEMINGESKSVCVGCFEGEKFLI